MNISFDRLAQFFLLTGLISALLSGCGSGGGGGQSAGNPDSEDQDVLTLHFQPDSSIISSGKDFLFLSLNTAGSANDLLVLDLIGTSLETTAASGVSADLQFDSAQMTFIGFEADDEGIGIGLAAPMETDQDTLIIGLQTLKRSTGHLGTIQFQLKPGIQISSVDFTSSLRYVSPSGSLLSDPSLTGRGGTILIQK